MNIFNELDDMNLDPEKWDVIPEITTPEQDAAYQRGFNAATEFYRFDTISVMVGMAIADRHPDILNALRHVITTGGQGNHWDDFDMVADAIREAFGLALKRGQ